ncbi:MAG TPA: HDOD domain-containing protein [Bacillota bacterium]|nr:HDOD domain-containing protein [Bacillota bacterium]
MEVFVARQPIFDKKLQVFAYELLYRIGMENHFSEHDGDRATSEVIANSFLLIGTQNLTVGKRAFINFTHNLIMNQTPMLLPREQIAVEILESVTPCQELIHVCRQLKDEGYMLVLDDFVFREEFLPLIELADIVKVDFLSTPVETRQNLIRNFRSEKTKFLAEKLENRGSYELALEMGYDYFQGNFFAVPDIMTGKEVPGYKINYLRMLREVHRPEVTFEVLENIVKRDISLSFKLLTYINSAAFGVRCKIKSLKQALVMLGFDELKKWISIAALKSLGEDRPNEVFISSLVRARFGELVAEKMNSPHSSDIFLMGMLSRIDVFINREISEVVEDLPISDEIKKVLSGQQGEFSQIFQLVVTYEQGEWDRVEELARDLRLCHGLLPELFLDAVKWTVSYS